jgi:predicted ribosome quality control (RQC) complex YloA/Tae2 family protein
MFDLSNLQNIKANEIADAKIEKLRAEQEAARREIEKAEREIEQGENKIKRLKRSLSKEERNARTKRLIERGAILEAFIPDAENLTNDEIQAALANVFRADIPRD